MMGAGKTTIGRLAAAKMGRVFLDVDSVVEAESGMTIADLFARHGEGEFRRRELDAITRLIASPAAAVLAAGGGAFCQAGVREYLKGNSVTVFLRVPEGELLRRLEAAGVAERPLLSRPDWRERVGELVRTRYPLYGEAALVLDVGGESPEETAERLVAMVTACPN